MLEIRFLAAPGQHTTTPRALHGAPQAAHGARRRTPLDATEVLEAEAEAVECSNLAGACY